ncbi:MAG: TRAP transporter small permease [Deltaproteobacteria bacterium]|nr:MAG: TRAP transporter small permease [Deltaproteobacteria bacterium]RUA01216.1 MAG: TRAP transporter small permease [Deltaproteobacteria bacterium]
MLLLEKINLALNRLLVFIGGFFLVGMILLACANIFSRLVWVPIRGTFELMGYFGAVVTAFALGYTQLNKGHIAVDVLVNTFSKKTQRIIRMINHLLGALFFALAAWQISIKAATLMRTGEVTETLRIIYYPFTCAVALGCIVLALVLITDLLKLLMPEKEISR